ncbi:MAG: type II toxin-antitoxin system VapC family toxin [Acidimicrobiales bacterium]
MIVYFDTSAVVKLLVEEPGSITVEALWAASAARVIATIGRAEATAALARSGRIGRLSPARVRRGVVDLTRLWGGLRRVPVDDGLAADAAKLALAHDLRGFDAVHLAAANVSADTFVAADRRLLTAARSEGLSVADVAA